MLIADVGGMQRGGGALLQLGAPAVLMKGGHLPGAMVRDLLATASGAENLRPSRGSKRATRMAPAARWLAVSRLDWRRGFRCARRCAGAGLCACGDVGRAGIWAGHGPMNHAVTVYPARLIRGPATQEGARLPAGAEPNLRPAGQATAAHIPRFASWRIALGGRDGMRPGHWRRASCPQRDLKGPSQHSEGDDVATPLMHDA